MRWKTVPGFPDYQVSDRGWIRSLKWDPPRVLRTWVEPGGYSRVQIRNEDGPRMFYVHRLVLLTFIGPAPEGCEAHHWDTDTLNNSLSNLDWIPAEDNHPSRAKQRELRYGGNGKNLPRKR